MESEIVQLDDEKQESQEVLEEINEQIDLDSPINVHILKKHPLYKFLQVGVTYTIKKKYGLNLIEKQYAREATRQDLFAPCEDMPAAFFETAKRELRKQQRQQNKPTSNAGSSGGLDSINYEAVYANAKSVVDDLSLCLDRSGIMWYMDNGIFVYCDQTTIENALKEKFGAYAALNPRIKDAYKAAIRGEARKNFDLLDSTYGFEQPRDKVFFKTLCFDVRQQKEVEYNGPVFARAQFDPSDNEDTPNIDEQFRNTTDGDARTIKDIIAYCHLPTNPEKAIFVFHGAQDSGKSTNIKIMENYFGDKNSTSQSLSLVSSQSNRFAIGNLRNKIIIVYNESDKRDLAATSNLKAISGNDKLRGEKKGVDGQFDFVPIGKQFINTNYIPTVKDNTDKAFNSRMLIIDHPKTFPRTLLNREWRIPSNEYANLATYCYNRIKEWYEQGYIEIHNLALKTDERIKIYDVRSNPLISFFNERVEFDESVAHPEDSKYDCDKEPLFKAYNLFRQNKGLRQLEFNEIGTEVYNAFKGQTRYVIKQHSGDDRRRFYKGFRLKPAQQVLPKDEEANPTVAKKEDSNNITGITGGKIDSLYREPNNTPVQPVIEASPCSNPGFGHWLTDNTKTLQWLSDGVKISKEHAEEPIIKDALAKGILHNRDSDGYFLPKEQYAQFIGEAAYD